MHNKPNLQYFKKECPHYSFYYALVDCAQDDILFPLINQSTCEKMCLFRYEDDSPLKEVSPHLVALADDEFANHLFAEIWGHRKGIFLASDKPLADLVRHFRKITKVRNPKNKNWYFRFYDPNVLRMFLPGCNHHQFTRIMGDVGTFWLEDEDSDYALTLERLENELQITRSLLNTNSAHNADIPPTISKIFYTPTESRFYHPNASLRITGEQAELAGKISRRVFTHKVTEAFKEGYPRELQAYDYNQLFQRIDHAIEQYLSIGANERRECYYFVNASVLFGWDFLTDKNHVWIRRDYLDNVALGTMHSRLHALYEHCHSLPAMDDYDRIINKRRLNLHRTKTQADVTASRKMVKNYCRDLGDGKHNLIALASECLKIVRYFSLLKHRDNEEEGLQLLKLGSEAYAAYFSLARDPKQKRAIKLKKCKTVTLDGQGIVGSGSLSPECWQEAYYTAVVARDEASMASLAIFPVAFLHESPTQSLAAEYKLVEAIQSHHFGRDDVISLITEASELAQADGSRSARDITLGKIEVLRALVNFSEHFNEILIEKLRLHIDYYDERETAEGDVVDSYIAMELLGMATQWFLAGKEVTVESDYLPRHCFEGTVHKPYV